MKGCITNAQTRHLDHLVNYRRRTINLTGMQYMATELAKRIEKEAKTSQQQKSRANRRNVASSTAPSLVLNLARMRAIADRARVAALAVEEEESDGEQMECDD